MWCKHLNKQINIDKDFQSECDKCSSEYIKSKFNVDIDDDDYELDNYTAKDQFLYDFEKSKKQMIILVVNRPEAFDSKEIIINSSELESKIEHYRNTYDDDLKLKRNPDIFIENYIFI